MNYTEEKKKLVPYRNDCYSPNISFVLCEGKSWYDVSLPQRAIRFFCNLALRIVLVPGGEVAVVPKLHVSICTGSEISPCLFCLY